MQSEKHGQDEDRRLALARNRGASRLLVMLDMESIRVFDNSVANFNMAVEETVADWFGGLRRRSYPSAFGDWLDRRFRSGRVQGI